MSEMINSSVYFGTVLTLLAFSLGKYIRKKANTEICNPILIAVIVIIAFLLVTKTDYKVYKEGSKLISMMLTPTTICLAIPLYEQFEVLKKNAVAVLLGIFSGVIASIGSVTLLSMLFGLSHAEWVTVLPKSVTSAIGMDLAAELGGNAAIAVAVIILTGITGNMLAKGFLRLIKVTEPVAVGTALGTASHAIGTSKACEIGDVEGAMSSLSIVTAGIITVIICGIIA
ncbi:MAG: LrgB family protein [Eubacteriales bacterium]|nr:LrgB family protein [Eubacteriales bacterium]